MCELENGKDRRDTGAPDLGAPFGGGEAWRMLVMTRTAAVVAAAKEGTGVRGERESEGYAIGASPWQSARSSGGSRPG